MHKYCQLSMTRDIRNRSRNSSSLLFSSKVLLQRTLKVFRGHHYQQQQCYNPIRSVATTTTTGTTDKSTEYKNFSHKSLSVEQVHDMPQTMKTQDKLVFGKQFTPHMLQIQYNNQQWGEPKIVPYQNLSISPAASSLHYGTLIVELHFVRLSLNSLPNTTSFSCLYWNYCYRVAML